MFLPGATLEFDRYDTKMIREPGPRQVRLRVAVCGVCRADLHLAEGDLAPKHPRVVPAARWWLLRPSRSGVRQTVTRIGGPDPGAGRHHPLWPGQADAALRNLAHDRVNGAAVLVNTQQ
jgi:hypothetical protein